MSGRPLSIGAQSGSSYSILHLSSTGGSDPLPARKSHYRPFSALNTQSSSTGFPPPQSPSLRRSASVGGLHQFRNTMGLQFGSKGRKELVRANTSTVLPPLADRPSSRPPTKKRSMASMFAASDGSPASPSSSPGCSDELPVIDISKRHVSFEELDGCGNFVPKNIWAKRCNMKLHPYHKQVAYMQAYDPVSLEIDRYTELLCQRLTNGSPSFHDYGSKPPTMVLDLGCGPGHWILHAANLWKDTEFVGFDIVDITLPAFETVENVRLVQGDFLNYHLPFPDNTFDFVRMSNLALCIPYDQWEFVLRQVHRVLTPGGRLELIDDDIYFPYGKEIEAIVPASPPSGSSSGDERWGKVEAKITSRDAGDNEMMQGEHTDSIMNPEVAGHGTADSSPTTSDLTFKSANTRLLRSRSHYVLRRNGSTSRAPPHDILSDAPRSPDPTHRRERTDLNPRVSSRSPTLRHLRQSSGTKTITPPDRSSTPKNGGNLANPSPPPRPKRTREKVALLPPIRSITPTCSLSIGTKYSPTWSLRTADTSPTSSDASSIGTKDTSPTASVRSVAKKVDPNWQRKVSASKDMESLFEKMLVEQYGIHPRPAEFMLQALGKVFDEDGNDEAEVRVKNSFHIKLAPAAISEQSDGDSLGGKGRGQTSMDKMDDMSKSTRKSSTSSTIEPEKPNGISAVTTLRSKPWEQGRDKRSKGNWPRIMKEKDKDKSNPEEQRGRQSKETQAGAVNTAVTMTASLFKKSRLHDPALSTPVSPALSAKAAIILGIQYSELSAATSSSLNLSSSAEKRSSIMPLPYPCSKTAGRLGIPHSESISAAASLSNSVPGNVDPLTEPSTCSPTTGLESTPSPSNTSGATQHAGLLIWPDTYVPMAAGELEMHACKYIHTVLGCRPALEEFVAKFVDERGHRIVGEEEFKDEIWEYECFRRARFNWPSEVSDPYEDDLPSPNATESSSTTPNTSGTGSSGTVDANHTTATTLEPSVDIMTGSVPALQTSSSTATTHQPCATDDFGGFSNEKSLWPTKSSLRFRSSSVNRERSPSIPMKAKTKMPPFLRTWRSASPAPSSLPPPSCSRRDSHESMTDGNRALDDLVHLRSIRVFEGIKAA